MSALAADYGPVFANGEKIGVFKMDLGSVRLVSDVTSWSHNQNGNRARQRFTVYGSSASTDPGWNTQDAAVFVPLGTIDTASIPGRRSLPVRCVPRTVSNWGDFAGFCGRRGP